jgi:uncharacterized protein YutE (UPF0331/DUF86 family)
MADDVLVNKAAAIERSVRRVREEHAGDDRNLLENQTRQDAMVLNLQRACETSIDAAMHVVRVRRLGVPQETREAFDLLENAGIVRSRVQQRQQLRRERGAEIVDLRDTRGVGIELRHVVPDADGGQLHG